MDPFRIRVRPELIRTEYVFDPSGFDPKYLFISVFAKNILKIPNICHCAYKNEH